MFKGLYRFFIILPFLCLIVACSQPNAVGTTTVLIIRHAEKADDSENSSLNSQGIKRAQDLVSVVENSNIQAIYTTQFKRNQDTVIPAAQKLGIQPVVMPISDLQNPGSYPKLLSEDILAKHRGQAVLVVGHGTTIAPLIESLAGQPISTGDIAYSDFFVVEVSPGSPGRVTKLKYGDVVAQQ